MRGTAVSFRPPARNWAVPLTKAARRFARIGVKGAARTTSRAGSCRSLRAQLPDDVYACRGADAVGARFEHGAYVCQGTDAARCLYAGPAAGNTAQQGNIGCGSAT